MIDQTLEPYALQILALDQPALIAAALLPVVAGFALGAVLPPDRQGQMARIPYLVLLGLLTLGLSACGYVVLWLPQGLAAGQSWRAMAAYAGATMVLGYGLGVIARYRTKDTYGTAGRTWIAVIPLFALALAFRKPLIPAPPAPALMRVSQGAAGLLGLMLLAAARLVSKDIEIRSTAMTAAVEDAAQYVDVGFAARLAAIGLDAALSEEAARILADSQAAAQGIIAMSAEGQTLRYLRQVPADFALTPDLQRLITMQTCQDPHGRVLMTAGATIAHAFQDAAGRDLGQVAVLVKDCSAA